MNETKPVGYEVFINLGFGESHTKRFKKLEVARKFIKQQRGRAQLYMLFREVTYKKVEIHEKD